MGANRFAWKGGRDRGNPWSWRIRIFFLSLRAQAPHRAFFFHNPGFRRARVWLTLWAALATLALGLGLYKWGIPLVADLITPHVPVSWEEHLGESQLKLMVPPATRLENPRLERAIGVILARLTGTLPHCPYHFHVTVSNQPVINAFALPGGNIVVYRGLLELTHSPEELAGVLAHEMQHVLKRHSTRRIIPGFLDRSFDFPPWPGMPLAAWPSPLKVPAPWRYWAIAGGKRRERTGRV